MASLRLVRESATVLSSIVGLVACLGGCGDSAGYRRVGGGWSFDGSPIPGAHAASFEPLGDRYARDALRGYYRGQAVDESDGATFTALSEHEAHDRRAVYFCDTFRKAEEYWSIPRVRIARIDGADPATYRPLGRGHARDARRVYADGRPFDVRDPATFEPLAGNYARDAQRGYFDRVEIHDSQGPTFEVIDAQDAAYARDRSRAFYAWRETDTPNRRPYPVVRTLREVDPAALRVLGRGYAVDPRHVWFRGAVLAGADAATFRIDTTFVGEVDATDRLGPWHAGRRWRAAPGATS